MATDVVSEVSGTVWKVEAAAGTSLIADAPIMVIESMKMEIPVVAPCAGRLVRLLVAEGDAVQEGQIVAEIE
jgi:biotin carboxyl carrier protein